MAFFRKKPAQARNWVDPALVRRIEESPALAGATAPTIQRIDFVAVLIDDQNLDELCKRVAAAVTALMEAGALVEGLTGSLLFATFGVIRAGDSTAKAEQRSKAVSAIHEQLGQSVRIVHGVADALVGDIGGGRGQFRWSHFGAVPRGCSEMLKLLTSLNPGDVREW